MAVDIGERIAVALEKMASDSPKSQMDDLLQMLRDHDNQRESFERAYEKRSEELRVRFDQIDENFKNLAQDIVNLRDRLLALEKGAEPWQ